MQGAYILAVYVTLFVVGLSRPFVMGLGYVWTDLFRPEDMYPTIMGAFPVSLIMGSGAAAVYLVSGRKYLPRFSSTLFLLISFGLWMTLACTWAEAPEAVWSKWDWAIKTFVFAVMIPFLFQSRVQIEAFVLTIIFAVCGVIVPVGIKTVISGGGYDFSLSPLQVESGIGEGATLGMSAATIIPLIIFGARCSIILPWIRVRIFGSVALVIACVTAVLGTFERTSFVALAATGGLLTLQSKRKVMVGTLIILVAAAALPIVGSHWMDRMQTISTDPTDDSARIRLAVWSWTIDYVKVHPFGGGLNLFYKDTISLVGADEHIYSKSSVAAHSIYFEILGETGIAGLLIWIMLIMEFYRGMWVLRRRVSGFSELIWLHQLINMLSTSVTVYLIGGTFIGIAYQPLLYYMISLGICLREYYRRWEGSDNALRSVLRTGILPSVPAPKPRATN